MRGMLVLIRPVWPYNGNLTVLTNSYEVYIMKIVDFLNEVKQKAHEALLEVSGGGTSETKSFPFSKGTAEIITIRGGTVEKAAITHLQLEGVKPPGADSATAGVVFQMEIFPENPYCPMGHFNTEWRYTQEPEYHMNIDLFPAVAVREDLDGAKKIMDAVAERFKKDKDAIREGLAVQYNMDHWQAPLAAQAGFQLKGIRDSELDLYITAYQTFFDAYIDIFKKRKDSAFTEQEMRLKRERNGKWLQYLALKDRAVKMGQAVGIPSEVLIGLGYPPSAVF